MGHMGGVLQISYLIKHGSDAYAMNDALLIACSRHSSQTGTPPSAWRRIARIWGSLYLVIFIKISSDILPRKFYFRIPLVSGGDYPILAQDLPLSTSKIAFARRAIPYSSRW